MYITNHHLHLMNCSRLSSLASTSYTWLRDKSRAANTFHDGRTLSTARAHIDAQYFTIALDRRLIFLHKSKVVKKLCVKLLSQAFCRADVNFLQAYKEKRYLLKPQRSLLAIVSYFLKRFSLFEAM